MQITCDLSCPPFRRATWRMKLKAASNCDPFPRMSVFPGHELKIPLSSVTTVAKSILCLKQIERQNKSKLHRELIQENYSKCRKLETIFWTIMLESYAGLGIREWIECGFPSIIRSFPKTEWVWINPDYCLFQVFPFLNKGVRTKIHLPKR